MLLKVRLRVSSGIAILSSLLFATGALAGEITGSAHDFTDSEGWTSDEDQICVFCHTPHNADTTVADAPLWNHTLTEGPFDMYTSPTLDAIQSDQPDGSSLLCLSCHDGTVAIDAYGNNQGSHFVPQRVNLGTDLRDDHPISIIYDPALSETDQGLHDPSTEQTTVGSGDKVRTGTIDEVMLFNGKLQCASCHDVHNNFVYQDTNNKLLVRSPEGSELCLTCHDK